MRIETYASLTAAIAVDATEAARFDLLAGMHPSDGRWLTEEERFPWSMDLVRADEWIRDTAPWTEVPRLWLRHFPELSRVRVSEPGGWEALWRAVVSKAEVLHLAYTFESLEIDQSEERKRTRLAASALHHSIAAAIANGPRAGRVTWTLPFPAKGPLGRVVEERAGLTSELKSGVGLGQFQPGLLMGFINHHQTEVERLLNPSLFEELVSILFELEGWEVHLTRKTRDGGKDVVARRLVEGVPVLAYVEAKRYCRSRTVGISKVKEFVATVAGDNADQGYLVTTSTFSNPAKQWLRTKGNALAHVELVGRKELATRVAETAGANCGSFLLK